MEDLIEAEIGDIAVLKKFEELPEFLQESINEEKYNEQFAGKAFTICNIIKTEFGKVNKLGNLYEFEEDEDISTLSKGERIFFDIWKRNLKILNNVEFKKAKHYAEAYIKGIFKRGKDDLVC